ncbi:MAG: hypothetical protein ACYDCN_13715, partial [Bacteroidia bacterium]
APEMLEAVAKGNADIDKVYKAAVQTISSGRKPFHNKQIVAYRGPSDVSIAEPLTEKTSSDQTNDAFEEKTPLVVGDTTPNVATTVEPQQQVATVEEVMVLIEPTENEYCCGNPECRYFGQVVTSVSKGGQDGTI